MSKSSSDSNHCSIAARFRIGQHVHVDVAGAIEIPATVISIDDIADDTQRVYVVRCVDTKLPEQLTVCDSQLRSCDLVDMLRAEMRHIVCQNTWPSVDSDHDHGPGCDGPLNCTCTETDCARKVSEFDAVRSTLDNVIRALSLARDELRSWEIDDYADSDVVACAEAFEQIHGSASALIALVSVPDSAAVVDVGDAATTYAEIVAEHLRSGESVEIR